jgi:hypothetical protein
LWCEKKNPTVHIHHLFLHQNNKKMANTFGLTRETIVICDFGSQYSHIIARRVRELNVYCEMHSCLVEEKVLRAINLKGIILSGGPFSVYEDGAPHLQVRLLGGSNGYITLSAVLSFYFPSLLAALWSVYLFPTTPPPTLLA